jgi:hypothetical protein
MFSFFVAGPRDVTLNPLLGETITPYGITSGPGNQGSSATSMNMGHAGTPATQTGLPRHVGASTFTGTV